MPKLPTSQVCFRLSRYEIYGELPAPIWQRRWRAVERPMRRLGIYYVYDRNSSLMQNERNKQTKKKKKQQPQASKS